jgi:flagellar hook-basal body complex protein FliE
VNPVAATSSITSLQSISGATSGLGRTGGVNKVGGQDAPGGFSKLMNEFVQQTNDSQLASDQSIDQLVKGETDNIQQVVLAVANAEMSFQLFMEIRNKLIESYNELMRMQF